MTTVRITQPSTSNRRQVGGKLRWAVLVCLAFAAPASGQDGPVHWRHAGAMPPGAIGRQRLMRGGPLSGYCQPVEIRAPQGARIAPAADGGFGDGQPDQLLVGLAHRTRLSLSRDRHPRAPGRRGVSRRSKWSTALYPPPGQALQVPRARRSHARRAADGGRRQVRHARDLHRGSAARDSRSPRRRPATRAGSKSRPATIRW